MIEAFQQDAREDDDLSESSISSRDDSTTRQLVSIESLLGEQEQGDDSSWIDLDCSMPEPASGADNVTPSPDEAISSSRAQDDDEHDNLPPLDELDFEENSFQGKRQRFLKESAKRLQAPKRYFRYALTLWLIELVLVVTLKKCGVIKPDANSNFLQQLPSLPSKQDWWNFRLNESIPLAYLIHEKKRPGYRLAHPQLPLRPPSDESSPQTCPDCHNQAKGQTCSGSTMGEPRIGASAHYPVVLIPGFVTSGLEVWGGKECARKHFRQRLWAAFFGARSFLMDRDCWRQHMMLDPLTGNDPPGIHLRASSGFEAVDYFLANYWVFGKLIENLADLGYTPSDMAVEPYDWRLAFPLLEERDGYLTKLKARIESMHKTAAVDPDTGKKKKVVLTSHSMGALVVHYFFAWVTTPETKGGGGGGKDWVDKHIHAYINIAGSHLGVPKAATALLSGEMSDTVFLNPMGNMVEQFFGRRLRRDLWSTWGSLWAMLPKGGDALWSIGADMCSSMSPGSTPNPNEAASTSSDQTGDATSTTEDRFCPKTGFSPLLAVTDGTLARQRQPNADTAFASGLDEIQTPKDELKRGDLNGTINEFLARDQQTTREVIEFIQAFGAGYGSNFSNALGHSLQDEYLLEKSHRSGRKRGLLQEKPSSRTWHDPTRTPLPYAPNMKIYCMYGVGIPTERAYNYKRNVDETSAGVGRAAAASEMRDFGDPPLIHDSTMVNHELNIEYGVKYTDGDGSVPLLSLGYLCANAWQRKESHLNPSDAIVYTREYKHTAEFVVDDPMRGGPRSADHVDILGNVEMTEDLLRIVSNHEVEKVNQNRIVSDIKRIAQEINAHPHGGIGNKQRRRRSWFNLP